MPAAQCLWEPAASCPPGQRGRAGMGFVEGAPSSRSSQGAGRGDGEMFPRAHNKPKTPPGSPQKGRTGQDRTGSPRMALFPRPGPSQALEDVEVAGRATGAVAELPDAGTFPDGALLAGVTLRGESGAVLIPPPCTHTYAPPPPATCSSMAMTHGTGGDGSDELPLVSF